MARRARYGLRRVTQRWKLTIEYDGEPFFGWQRQNGQPSVQEALETAFLSFTGEKVLVYGAGRTDAGVHAWGQVAHVDLEKPLDARRIREAVNALVRPQPVCVLTVEPVALEFHARFSAIARRYLYRIENRRAPPIWNRGKVWHVPLPLDAEAMRNAAQAFVGRHDFSTFRSVQCQANSPVKTLDRFDVELDGDLILIHVGARSFLHHQVRSMVGSLKLVGEGKWTRTDLEHARDARDRKACGPVAPPDGLILVGVDYAAGDKSISSTPGASMA
jgi:tRNA pseudouridine38-40 synthase